MATTTRKENARLAAERRLYARKHGGDEVHELLGGKWRKVTKQDRRFWLAVRREEHDAIQGERKALQLARKKRQDIDYFDLDAFNELYRDGGKEWPVTQEQVDAAALESE